MLIGEELMKKIQLILIAPFLLSCDAFEDDEPEMDGYSVGKPASYVIHYPDGKTSIHQFVWDGNNFSRYRDNDLWLEVKNNDYGYGLEYQYYKPDGSKGTKRVYERSKDKRLSFKEYDSSGNLVKKDSTVWSNDSLEVKVYDAFKGVLLFKETFDETSRILSSERYDSTGTVSYTHLTLPTICSV